MNTTSDKQNVLTTTAHMRHASAAAYDDVHSPSEM